MALKTRHYARVLRNFDASQEPDLTVVQHLVDAGTTAIDLGANIGVYTKVLSSLVGREGRVISAEPVPQTFRILAHNVRTLQLKNVELVNAAVSDKVDTVIMQVPSNDFGGGNFYQARVIEDPSPSATAIRVVQVRSVTLDEIAAREEQISFVKCDVEGHELKCLNGGKEVIERHHPAWLIEVWGNPDDGDSTAAQVFDSLTQSGYSVWVFDGRLRQRKSGERATNYFFLTPTHVMTLRGSAPNLMN
jgi:FkbM family methyltransferase